MNKLYIWFIIICFGFFCSCSLEYDERVAPIAGNYEAGITGSFVGFDLLATIENGDNVALDGIFDEFNWSIISLVVRDKDDDLKRLEIEEQVLSNGDLIYGDGFYIDGSIQLDYFVDDGFGPIYYQLVASKF